MKQYWEKSITFDEYIKITENRIANYEQNDEYLQYYELGLQRMNRTLKTLKIDDELLKTLKSKNFGGKVLIITEPWCGDASATVPAVTKFFEAAGNEVKIFLRDSDTSLIDQFLTDGTQSIPKILLLTEDFEVINSWGPRSEFGTSLLKKFKESPETYPREDFYNDLQVYYAKNRGKDAITELLNLL